LKLIDYKKTGIKMIEACKAHEKYRSKECVNLIASEGLKSPAVNELLGLAQDLGTRYCEGENDLEGHVKARHYQGLRYIMQIENFAADLMKEALSCDWIDIRPLSGTQANQVTFFGLSAILNNNKMAVAPLSSGAHISHDYTGLAGQLAKLEIVNLIFNSDELNIDPDESAKIIRAARPGIVTFGGSLFQFPHPVKQLVNVAREVGAYVVYDAAHVLGLIASGQFQDPLNEGADFVTGSTHKTFPGPQGGLVFSNLRARGKMDERKRAAAKSIQHAIHPLSTSNTHPGRFPALGLAALEIKLWGEKLAKQTIKNAQAAGNHFFENGLNVLGEKHGFTKSHQIAVNVEAFGGGKKVAQKLENANIIVNKNLLPFENQKNKDNPSGIRVGFQDVTRSGYNEDDIRYLCDLMVQVIKDTKSPSNIRNDVVALAQKFEKVNYGFHSLDEAIHYLKK
jgi:glycine hydroxymethyltransferase